MLKWDRDRPRCIVPSFQGDTDTQQSLRAAVLKHNCRGHADSLACTELHKTCKTKSYISRATYVSQSATKLAAGEEEAVSIWGGGIQPRGRIYFIS